MPRSVALDRNVSAGLVLAAGLMLPLAAHAHLVRTGFGGFYDGALHLLITPEDILVVVGLGMLTGLRGPAGARGVLLTLPLAWLAGGLLGLGHPSLVDLPWLTAVSFAGVGLLVALDAPLPAIGTAALAALIGGLHGAFNGVAFAGAGLDGLALAGATAAAFVVVTLSAALVFSLRSYWVRIGVRVAGSWIAAVGMLMLGWLARGGR